MGIDFITLGFGDANKQPVKDKQTTLKETGMTREEKVKELIVKVSMGKIKEDMITLDVDLRKDLGLDSLAMVELLVLTEDAFGIKADKNDALAAGTLRMTLAFLDKYLKA